MSIHEKLLAVVFFALAALMGLTFCAVSRAEEPSCHIEGDTLVCNQAAKDAAGKGSATEDLLLVIAFAVDSVPEDFIFVHNNGRAEAVTTDHCEHDPPCAAAVREMYEKGQVKALNVHAPLKA